MAKYYSFLLIYFLIINVNSLLPPEKREELWNKYLKRISPDAFEKLETAFKYDYLEETYTYDVDEVNSVLAKYDFPQNYSFLEEHNITPNVKDQGYCGSCWSHAATSALAYRYKLKGLDLDLSPQDGVSCYLPDCETGNNLIDPQMNLVKNGTVTEQCFPFVSGDGETIPECPTKCKDGSEPKKYYSQSAYMTQDTITQDNYYEIIALIIDILINKGPVVSGIMVYKDFQVLSDDPERCRNTIYAYDGKSPITGGHAITLVGYGFMNNKFYWLLQNSWGPDACDNGFYKIEFGQVSVEDITFSEPYIEEGTSPFEIPVAFKEIDEECYLTVEVADEYLNNWKNSLEIIFKSGESSIKYQCSALSTKVKGTEYNCYFQIRDLFNKKGSYNFYSYESLGADNKFVMDTSQISSFNFYGRERLFPLFEENAPTFYVSGEGSKIIFGFVPAYEVEEKAPNIIPSVSPYPILSNCKKEKFVTSDIYLISCELTEEESSCFQMDNPIEITYQFLCGYYLPIGTFVNKLDTTKYPIFRIKSAFLEKVEIIDSNTIFTMIAEIDGSLSSYNESQIFSGLADIEYNEENTTYFTMCQTGLPKDESKEHSISCSVSFDQDQSTKYDNLYILPYIIPNENTVPNEVIINKIIKVSDGTEPDTTDQPPEPETDSDKTIPTDEPQPTSQPPSDEPHPTEMPSSDEPHPTEQPHSDRSSSNHIKLYSLFSLIILLIILY